MTTVATWGIKLAPGTTKFDSFPDEEELNIILRITNAALGENFADPNGRTVVKITKMKGGMDISDDEEDEEASESADAEEFVLCSLTPGKIEQVTLNVEFGPDLVQFEVIGKNEVHLLGNWIDTSSDEPPFDSDDDSDEDNEGAFRLEDVSSDVEMDPNELALDDDDDEDTDGSRFEELVGAAGNKKRSADAMEEDVAMDGLSKKQKKKLAKKLKNADGDAVATSVMSATSVTSVDAGASPDSKKKEKKDKKEKKEKEVDGAASKGGESRTLSGGLVVQDAKKGTGKTAKKGSQLAMRYIGKLENGKVFDKNTSGAPFRFRLGAGEVIKGWDQGLVGMQTGGERILTIPAALAYGSKGAKPDIPPNATLRFEVKLIEVK